MRILLADDQPRVCSALRLLLEQEPGLTVVGEAAESDALLAQVEAQHPDLVLLDWELPDENGPGSMRSDAPGSGAHLFALLRRRCPGLRVVALSGRHEARRAAQAAGVDAFVSKGDPPERLLETLRALG